MRLASCHAGVSPAKTLKLLIREPYGVAGFDRTTSPKVCDWAMSCSTVMLNDGVMGTLAVRSALAVQTLQVLNR